MSPSSKDSRWLVAVSVTMKTGVAHSFIGDAASSRCGRDVRGATKRRAAKMGDSFCPDCSRASASDFRKVGRS